MVAQASPPSLWSQLERSGSFDNCLLKTSSAGKVTIIMKMAVSNSTILKCNDSNENETQKYVRAHDDTSD